MYDPLLAKVVVSEAIDGDLERAYESARAKSLTVLDDFEIVGVNTNGGMIKNILAHPDFVRGEVFTSFVEKNLAELTKTPAKRKKKKAAANAQPVKVTVEAPFEGSVVEVKVKAGDVVQAGETIAVLSAMKLDTDVRVENGGTILEVKAAAGQQLSGGDPILVMESVAAVEDDSDDEEAGAASRGGRRGARGFFSEGDPLEPWLETASCPAPTSSSSVLKSTVRTDDARFQARLQANKALAEELKQRLAQVSAGGSAKSVEQHLKRDKFMARERIQRILDPGTKFLELSQLAAWGMYSGDVNSASVVTGVGIVHGRPCLFVANDATVKGGTYYPITVKKHLRAQRIAEKCGLPCVYLVDSGGAFLPLQAEVFPDEHHFGRIFYNQARMSAQKIPQVACVLGSCTAGGAYVPAMSEETIMVKGNATIFLGGPPLVKAATGEEVTAEELGGADVHTAVSGVADHYAKDEAEALSKVRAVIEHLGEPAHHLPGYVPAEAPKYDPEELFGIIPEDNRQAFDVKEVIARIVDGSKMHEFKPRYGPTLVTGFARIWGFPVGIIANQGILFSECALKAAHFIELCNSRGIPLLFLQNITGFMVGKEYETGGIAKNGAKMVTAVSCAEVPKLTVLLGGSHGAGNYGMCGRAYDPEFLFSWPNSRIGVMGGPQAAGVLSTVKNDQLAREGKPPMTEAELAAFQKPTLDKYEEEGSPYYATARLWDDGIIDPRDTRTVLGQCLQAIAQKQEKPKSTFGVFRM